MARKPKYDWDKIGAEYIAGGDAVTIRSLARKYGCACGALGKRSSAGGWMNKRRTYREQTRNKTLEKASAQAATWQAGQLEIAGRVRDKALNALDKVKIEQLDPTEIRLWIIAACKIEADIMRETTDQGNEQNLDHEQRIERLVALLRARGVVRDD
jgi:uncharacterized protein with von Willebrand factor type A (vWA) domain